jgi:hypothetical protein
MGWGAACGLGEAVVAELGTHLRTSIDVALSERIQRALLRVCGMGFLAK